MFYKRSIQVKVKKVGNDTALYVSDPKGIHVLNDTALFIWEALQDPFTFDELLFMLRETYKGDAVQMEADLQEILDIFLRHHLVSKEK